VVKVYRVHADSEPGGLSSFVVKREGAEAVARALRFHRAVGGLEHLVVKFGYGGGRPSGRLLVASREPTS
jgi:hypothetical protein